LGLLTADGDELPVQLEDDEETRDAGTRLLLLQDERQTFTFKNVPSAPVPSLFRDFSAPVQFRYDYTPKQLATLIASDSDAFVRWDAAQRMAESAILEQVEAAARGGEMALDEDLVTAFRGVLLDRDADPALLAEAMALPDEGYLADQMEVVDVDGIHAARRFVRGGLAAQLQALLVQRYEELDNGRAYRKSAEDMAERSLKNTCLSYLLTTAQGEALARSQLERSDNMTDTLAALQGLVLADSGHAAAALAEFESRWSADALVMDKWFSLQAIKPGAATVDTVKTLMRHPAFSIRNPNKVRALIGVFSMLNPTGFHAADGSGYAFHADRVIELDRLNPQVAARMATAFNRWKHYDENRKTLMREQLRRIAAADGLSGDVAEIVGNALR
jgi:aminopeptidase N